MNFMDYLNTPAGRALTDAAGAGLEAYGRQKQQRASADFLNRKERFKTVAAARAGDRQMGVDRPSTALTASPLGEAQRFAQRSALLEAMAPGLREALGRFGISGFDFPSSANTLNAIVKRDMQMGNLDPNAPRTNLVNLFGASAQETQDRIAHARAAQKRFAEEEKARRDAALREALPW